MADPKTTGQDSAGSMSQVSIAALVGLVLVAAAIGFTVLRETPESAPEATETAADTPETAEEELAEAEAAAPEAVAPETAEAEESAEEAPAVAEPEPPRFDLVRVDATGGAVIAGRAPAGSVVTLVLDGETVESVTADAGGQFAAILSLEPSEVPRILGLRAVLPDGTEIEGAGTAIIAPFAGVAVAAAPEDPAPADSAELEAGSEAPAEETQELAMEIPAEAAPEVAEAAEPAEAVVETEEAVETAAVVPEPEAEGASEPEPVTEEVAVLAEPAPEAEAAPEPEATAEAEAAPEAEATAEAEGAQEAQAVEEVAEAAPVEEAAPAPVEEAAPAPVVEPETVAEAEAPAVLLADETGVRVLQGADGETGSSEDLRLDAITYDVAGAVTLAGRAPTSGNVRATLDNRQVTSGEVGPGGEWSLDLPDVDPGTYTLLLEQLAADGSVTGRIETPFLREDPERIRDNPMLVDPGATVITVQRGFTLWGIAEANFGDGIRYVQIFEENRDLIRDPDLIYPGQIFALPDLPRAAP